MYIPITGILLKVALMTMKPNPTSKVDHWKYIWYSIDIRFDFIIWVCKKLFIYILTSKVKSKFLYKPDQHITL